MHTSTFLACAVALMGSVATALPERRNGFCLNTGDAWVIANDDKTLVSAFTPAFANQVLAADYTGQLDSINTLIDNGGTAPVPVSAVEMHAATLLCSRPVTDESSASARRIDLCLQGSLHQQPGNSTERDF